MQKLALVIIKETENNIVFGCITDNEQIRLKVSVNEALEFIVESNFIELPIVHQLHKSIDIGFQRPESSGC